MPSSSAEVDPGEVEAVADAFVAFYRTLPKEEVDNFPLEHIYNMRFKHRRPKTSSAVLPPVLGFSTVQPWVVSKLGPSLSRPPSSSVGASAFHPPPSSSAGRSPTKIAIDQKMGMFYNRPSHRGVASATSDASQHRKNLAFPGLDLALMSFSGTGFDRAQVVELCNRTWPDLLLAMNTALPPTADLADFEVRGYHVFRQDFSAGSGMGILVYVNNRVDYSALLDLESPHHQAIWTKMVHPDSEVLENGDRRQIVTIVGNVCNVSLSSYDPGPHNSFLKYVADCVKKVRQQHPGCQILVQGNFAVESSYGEVQAVMAAVSAMSDMTVKFVKPDGHAAATGYLTSTSLKDQSICQDPSNPRVLSTKIRRLRCHLCRQGFTSAEEWTQHKASIKHRRNFCYSMWNEKKESLLRPKCGVRVMYAGTEDSATDEPGKPVSVSQDLERGLVEVTARPGIPVDLKFAVKNEGMPAIGAQDDPPVQQNGSVMDPTKGIVLKSVGLLTDIDGFEVRDGYGVTKPESEREQNLKPGVRVVPGRRLNFTLHFKKETVGQHRVPIVAEVRPYNTKMVYSVALEVMVRVSVPEMRDLEPKEPYVPNKMINRSWEGVIGYAEPGVKPTFKGGASKAKVPLNQYETPPTIKKLLNNGMKFSDKFSTEEAALVRGCRAVLEQGLSRDNYAARFRLLMQSEEHQMEFDIRNYDMEGVSMTKEGRFLYLIVPGLAENRPSVLRGDKLFVSPSRSGAGGAAGGRRQAYEGFVHEVHDTRVQLGFGQKLVNSFLPNMKFDVQFTFNRHPLRCMHRAVETVGKDRGLVGMVFPTGVCSDKDDKPTPQVNFISRDVMGNGEQMAAVRNILSDRLVGAPYVVFGPPGTGKTVTLIECMKQIYKRPAVGGFRILACTPSNSAADLIAKRLMDTVAKSEIVRTYAMSREERTVPEEIKEITTFNPRLPDLEKAENVMKYKVVVCTLIHAARLVTMGIPRGHFSHIFIDEAGHAQEPEALVPLAGFVDPSKTRVVLAGDPRQLGPILRSPISLRHGLQLSLLERIMSDPVNLKMYQRDPATNAYNSRYITKLLDNYRSHERLLDVPSGLFYEGELRAKADRIRSHSMLQWDGLPKGDFPVVFHGVVGVDKREGRSPSFFNTEEVAVVGSYLEQLLCAKGRHKVMPKDVAVIAPYRRQVQKIKELMNKKFQRSNIDFKKITVGSTEELQGQERRVIIISTVRSQEEFILSDIQHKLGFLKNPKRFNVAVTRAQALLVVVGNPNLLRQDPNWRVFIDHAYDRGGYKGVRYDRNGGAELAAGAEDKLTEKFKSMGLNDEPDEESFVHISQRELQEVPEWRADF